MSHALLPVSDKLPCEEKEVNVNDNNGKERAETGGEDGDSTEEDVEEGSVFEGLPDEVLLLIFSFLTTYDLLKRTTLVCRRWRDVAASPVLIRDLSFGPEPPTELLLRVVQSAPQLRRLTLYSRSDTNDLLRETTVSCPRLAFLKITTRADWRHVELEAEVLLEFLRVAKSLRYLSLKRVAFDDPTLVFEELGNAAPGLRGLNLNHSSQVDTVRLHSLVSRLPKLTDLRIYSISYNVIGSQTPYMDTPVVELLTRMGDTLEVLKLNMMGLTGHIMPFLATSVRLSVLHLYRATGIEDEAFILIASLSGLRELVVTVPRAISSACFDELFRSPGLSGLRILTVANSYSLDDSALEGLSTTCPHLEELGIPGCRRVTAGGLTSILAGCPGLLNLNLFSVRSSVTAAFPMIPLATPHLQLLIYKPVDVSKIDIPPELLTMPNLVIKTVYKYR